METRQHSLFHGHHREDKMIKIFVCYRFIVDDSDGRKGDIKIPSLKGGGVTIYADIGTIKVSGQSSK